MDNSNLSQNYISFLLQKKLENAVQAYRRGNFGLKECVRQFSISKTTLKKLLDDKNKRSNGRIQKMETFQP